MLLKEHGEAFMNRYVLSVDPGKNSGFAFYDLETRAFMSGEAPFAEICTRAEKATIRYQEDLQIVAEKFMITPNTHKNTFAPWSLEIIGVLRYLALQTENELILTKPSEAKNFCSNDRLRALGWFKGGAGHADDASRHLMLHLVTRRNWWDERLESTL